MVESATRLSAGERLVAFGMATCLGGVALIAGDVVVDKITDLPNILDRLAVVASSLMVIGGATALALGVYNEISEGVQIFDADEY